MKRIAIPAALIGGLLGAAAGAADRERLDAIGDPASKGRAIAEAADAARDGFDDYRAGMVMILRDGAGGEAVRRMHGRTLERDGGDWSLIVFDEPKDVEGTALLTYSHARRPDDQWLYLPALGRIKRIASNNKSGPFMGSEFAYEDLSSQEVEKYTGYRFLGDAAVDGHDSWRIERRPAYENSGYTRQIAWLDKAEFRVRKVEFYDRKDQLLKTLTTTGYQRYLDRYWYPDRMLMQNHQTGKSTVLEWRDYEFRNGFTERDFERAALKRVR